MLDKNQSATHDALEDAKLCMGVAQEVAKRFKSTSVNAFLNANPMYLKEVEFM